MSIIQVLIGQFAVAFYAATNLNIRGYSLAQLRDYINSLNNSEAALKLKFLALFVSIGFLILFVLVLVHMAKANRAKFNLIKSMAPPKEAGEGAAGARWGEIIRHIQSLKESEWKFAVIEADNLMDDVLKKAGFPGLTMGDRLLSIEKGKIQSLDAIWEAHKTRNRLVHDSNYFLRHAEAKRAVELYEKGLKEFRAI